MPSILKEIAPGLPSAEVTLSNGKTVTIKAVTNRQWVKLFERFPGLAKTSSQEEENVIVNFKSMAAVIAAGLGNPDDPEEEEQAELLPVTDRRALMRKINELSFPEEIPGPLPNGSDSSKPSETNE